MTVQHQLPTARVERVLPVAPGDAYDAWLQEEALRDFICPAPGRAASVSIDPRIGGRLRFVMAFPDREIEVSGEYIALERPSHISFTWRCSDTGDLESIVTVAFAPHGNGETLMTITHSKQPARLVEKHRAGWSSVADQLHASLTPQT
jgi:uncharacterized protein YndB with AHSA1/START domain